MLTNQVQCATSQKGMLKECEPAIQNDDISYEDSIKILSDMCSTLEVESAYELAEVAIQYKNLIRSIPTMEKMLFDIKEIFKVEDDEQIMPELAKVLSTNPHSQNKICKLLLAKDMARASEEEIIERINYLLTLEKHSPKGKTLEGNKLEVV